MPILIGQLPVEIQADETNIHHAQNQKELVLVDGFAVPQTNAFGHNFRDYTVESARQQGVEFFYKINHFNQTYDYVSKMRVEYAKLDKAEMSIWECCELLNDVVDDSDPDLDEPQIQHLLQSAEAIRKDYPNEDWLHLTALIHDLGKVHLPTSFGELPQRAVVGDTFPVGCAFHDSIVHSKYFKENLDYNNPAYNNKFGVYSEDCINLKHKIQDLIDPNVVSLHTVAPNVNSNSLPNHGGATINKIETDDDWCVTKAIVPIALDELERAVALLSIREKKEFVILTPEKVVALVSRETLTQPKFVIETAVTQDMTRSGRCYTSEELAQGGQKKDQTKRPISEAEAEEFWRKMQPKDYSIVKHLEKTPAQISVLALLMSSQLHRQALMKALNDTYVPVGINSDNLAAMINQVIRGHRISFCDEELPFEGRMHNKALHVTTMCQDKIINRVLIDDGSGLNICPLSTLRLLKFDVGKLHQNQVNVRAFDGVQRDTLGAVNLDIHVGPAEFNVEFQVLDINTSYNLLLGRPFIHMAGAVPSTLHQLMKFVWKDQELVIYGEGSHSNGYASVVDDVSRGCDFYTVELVNTTGDDLVPQPPMPAIYKMIATVMLRNGFEPGFGLGKHFQGIIEPIQIPTKGAKFGLGYVPTDDEAEMKNKNVDQALARPIPHLYQSFPVRGYVNDDGLREGICGLFEEIDAVIEEEAGTSGIRDAESEERLQNWTSTPLLISRSSG